MRVRNKTLTISICLISFFMLTAFMQAEKTDKIKQMNLEIMNKGYTFAVDRNPVSEKKLSQICGLIEPPNWRETGKFDGNEGLRETLPSSFDWRDYGYVTSVKNQGSCGSCWAFGTLGSYEGSLLLYDEGSQNLSEQWLVDCNSHGWGCNGGWFAFDEMYDGTPLESCYPYVGYDQYCQTGCPKYFPIDDWFYVGSSSGVPSTTAIKTAIYNHGPIAVAVYVNSYFQNYSSGIFNGCTSGSVNHGVVLVGWNDTGGYWILKNSWGTGWGENGYMRIQYGCNQVGYAACYAIPEATIPDTDPPVISNVNAVNITDDTARIVWDTDESATSVVYYGTTTSYGNTASTGGYTTSHSVDLTGLTPDTLYHYKVESSDSSDNTAQSGDYTFTTLPESQEPEIYVYDISMQKNSFWIFYRAQATITIRDTNNDVVPNATVYTTWSGKWSGTRSGTTNSSGQVTLTTAWVWGNGTFTVTVTDVTHATYDYNPALNNETSDSI